MSREPDWYQVLGVLPNDSPAVIKAAFRKKARETHPDTTQNAQPEAFYLVRKAGELLLDPDRRSAYDLRRQHIGPKPTAYPDSVADWTSLLVKTLGKMEAQSWQSHNTDANYSWLYDHYQAFVASRKSFPATLGASKLDELLSHLLAYLPHLAYRDQDYFLQLWGADFKEEAQQAALAAWQKSRFWHRLWNAHQLWWVLLLTALILGGLALF